MPILEMLTTIALYARTHTLDKAAFDGTLTLPAWMQFGSPSLAVSANPTPNLRRRACFGAVITSERPFCPVAHTRLPHGKLAEAWQPEGAFTRASFYALPRVVMPWWLAND